MTSAEIADKFKVTRRTAQRWIKSGAPVDDPAKMRIWIEEHQSHAGRSKYTAGEQPAEPSVLQPTSVKDLSDDNYDFSSTDRLIGNLSSMAGRAARDLEAARSTGSGPAVARASKVFNDSVHQLRQALISRDQLQSSAGASYSPEEIAWAFAQIWSALRYLLTDQFPRLAEQTLWDKELIDLNGRNEVEASIRTTNKTSVLSAICDGGADFSSSMLKTRKLSTLNERQELFHAVTRAWNPESV